MSSSLRLGLFTKMVTDVFLLLLLLFLAVFCSDGRLGKSQVIQYQSLERSPSVSLRSQFK